MPHGDWRWCRKELAHVCLHDATRVHADRDLAEIEAESVAYSLIWTGGPR
jgi:hypothetical protein